MSLQILRDETNHLLRRREVSCRFEKANGFLTRASAEKAIAEAIKTEPGRVFTISLRGEFGSMTLDGLFYIYDDEKLAQQRIPEYVKARRLPKEERKKAKEKKPTKPEAKSPPQKAASESKEEKPKEAEAKKPPKENKQ
jgi:ribosomal protein S24E